MSVARARREISPQEFNEWRAYLTRVEPHGAWRGDIQAGIIAAAIRNSMRSSDSDPFSASDFIPDFDSEPEEPPEPIDPVAAKAHLHFARLKAQQEREKKQ